MTAVGLMSMCIVLYVFMLFKEYTYYFFVLEGGAHFYMSHKQFPFMTNFTRIDNMRYI